MTRNLLVLTGPGASAGFALAGVEVKSVADSESAVRALETLSPRIGVVMIDEGLYQKLPEELRRGLNRAAEPVVIPVPGPDWTDESKAHEYIVELLRRAIGYRVRLQ
jgi:vacuolar-type H+-ATPase subunit F/Vma7